MLSPTRFIERELYRAIFGVFKRWSVVEFSAAKPFRNQEACSSTQAALLKFSIGGLPH
jgi:hypothetical protein